MGERIWIVQQDLALSGVAPGSDAGVVAAFPNILAVARELGGDGGESPFMQRGPWPAASELEVTITDPAWALDWWGTHVGPVVSARLRAAWSGASDGIEYHLVDASRSCAEAQAADYRLMHVMAEESVVDPARSDYDTAPQLSWLPEGFPFYVRSFAVREDAVPKHVLFRDVFARNHIFCTDAMALRALMACCSGVRFIDPATQRLMQPTRYRTLEGVAAGMAGGDSAPCLRCGFSAAVFARGADSRRRIRLSFFNA
jgi:hypothetical protein